MFEPGYEYEIDDVKYFQNKSRDLVITFPDGMVIAYPAMYAEAFTIDHDGMIWVGFQKEEE